MSTHIAESPTGRLHLTNLNGWAHGVCGVVLGEIGAVAVDDTRLCRSCLRQEAASVPRSITFNAGRQANVANWDSDMAVAVGEFMLQRLEEDPPPESSRWAESFSDWGRRLIASGTRRRRRDA